MNTEIKKPSKLILEATGKEVNLEERREFPIVVKGPRQGEVVKIHAYTEPTEHIPEGILCVNFESVGTIDSWQGLYPSALGMKFV